MSAVILFVFYMSHFFVFTAPSVVFSVRVYNFQDPHEYVGAYQSTLCYLVSQIFLLNFWLVCCHCLLLISIAWNFFQWISD